jgi:hypothetical protein
LATRLNLLAADNKTAPRRVDYKDVTLTAGHWRTALQQSHRILPREAQPAASADQGCGRSNDAQDRQGTALGKAAVNPFMEARLIRTYLNLFLVPRESDGSRKLTLARFGAYEVRLFEVAPEFAADTLPLWMELYAHDSGLTLDSFGCDDLDAAVQVADELTALAKMLHEHPTSTPPAAVPLADDPVVKRRLDFAREVVSLLRNAGLCADLVPPDNC